ncbi:hypothetical protein [Arachidicoccus rhizosphaerae]|jgi:hypothetical protein|nr:hypothetical protein [Arachidicoccus rhizosphaerae]
MFRYPKNVAEIKMPASMPEGWSTQAAFIPRLIRLSVVFVVIIGLSVLATHLPIKTSTENSDVQTHSTLPEMKILSPLVDLPALQGALLPGSIK